MNTPQRNAKVDARLRSEVRWRDEFEELRTIVLDCGLTEELKWGCPCYTVNGGNVVLIHGFKDYCALLFHKGVLLTDPAGILVQQTKNVQSARQIRFRSLDDIVGLRHVLKDYILAAAAVERSGQTVAFKKSAEFDVPEEFRDALENVVGLQQAFEALTPGRQRGYLLHFSSAKQATTRLVRIAKNIPRIMEGKGLED